jgi:hypothetical protein
MWFFITGEIVFWCLVGFMGLCGLVWIFTGNWLRRYLLMSDSQHRDYGTEAVISRKQHTFPRRAAAAQRDREQRQRPWLHGAARRDLHTQGPWYPMAARTPAGPKPWTFLGHSAGDPCPGGCVSLCRCGCGEPQPVLMEPVSLAPREPHYGQLWCPACQTAFGREW